MVIDAGNAHFKDTRRREAALKERYSIHFVGMGVSGGEKARSTARRSCQAARRSPTTRSARCLRRYPQGRRTPCCMHIGPDGAGHFVKMVHTASSTPNAADRRGYDLLRQGGGLTRRRSPRPSRLEHRPPGLLPHRDHRRGPRHQDAKTGKPFVDIVLDQAEQKGTGRWTVQDALDLGSRVSASPRPCSPGAFRHADLRAAARDFPGPRAAGAESPTSRTSPPRWSRRCTPRRSSPTPRAGT